MRGGVSVVNSTLTEDGGRLTFHAESVTLMVACSSGTRSTSIPSSFSCAIDAGEGAATVMDDDGGGGEELVEEEASRGVVGEEDSGFWMRDEGRSIGVIVERVRGRGNEVDDAGRR